MNFPVYVRCWRNRGRRWGLWSDRDTLSSIAGEKRYPGECELFDLISKPFSALAAFNRWVYSNRFSCMRDFLIVY